MRVWAGALRAAAAPGPLTGSFRERFDFGGRDVASWFPGHMAKGLRQMRASLRRADCLIEVHDARIPLSGRNPMLQEALGIRPHVLVLNKMDLADPRRQPTVLERLKQQGCSHVVFTDCQRDGNVKKIVPLVAKLVGDSPRYHRAEVRHSSEAAGVLRRERDVAIVRPRPCGWRDKAARRRPGFAVTAALSLVTTHLQSTEYNILVIGVPNVGKSSLINSLRRLHLKKGISQWCLGPGSSRQHSHGAAFSDRVSPFPKGKATAVGGEPGVTKAVLTKIQVPFPRRSQLGGC
ncbi:mitochondrial ribosome-associated GTPase 1 isoform X5 [Patagioenas fasciata]|uniref:mitochondrial ribosome-associated GTPase 1 isoform X5 n=1 Tax=Patagioenas fasciata TaxID=372321 RepID=UPI003A9A657C